MICYLCAYQATHQPKQPRGLPAGSPARPTDPLGTCDQCGVWACSGHASRFGAFLCAMCRSSTAITGVLAPPAPATPRAAPTHAAMGVAWRVGEAAPDHWDRVADAVRRVAADQARGLETEGVEPDEANLVWNLVGALEQRPGAPERWLGAVREPRRARLLEDVDGLVAISLDAVAGAVHGALAGARAVELTHTVDVVVTGALIIAMTVADDPDAADQDGDAEVDPNAVPIKLPWQVSHPILLSPVVWPLAIAYHDA